MALGVLVFGGPIRSGAADDSEKVGLTAMRRERPTILGTGVRVAQPEGGGATWEAPPFLNPQAAFTWTSSLGTATNYPNSVGAFSDHAQGVGNTFYRSGVGIAPGVSQVDNYEALFFITNKIALGLPIAAQVVNQSFIFSAAGSGAITTAYDEYAARYNVLFVSGMNNQPDAPPAPGDAFNGIGVGILSSTAQTSVGPTADGRSKPDLVAPHFCCSSFSTPYVAGGAALLLQAAAANEGGADTASISTNSATIKALLLNGAVKMTNWTNAIRRPLDARYGAGLFNIYNSDMQLRGGRRPASETNSVSLNAVHPPSTGASTIPSLRGWDYSSIQSPALNDRVAHYYFDLPAGRGIFSATATLVWKKGTGVLTNLDLFLYDTANNALVASSASTVDNVEHLFITKLPAGRYDLQVLKRGSALAGTESYALAFDFSSEQLAIARDGTNVTVAWAASPAGLTLQTAPSLDSPMGWQTLNVDSVLSNGLNTATFPTANERQYFRLVRP